MRVVLLAAASALVVPQRRLTVRMAATAVEQKRARTGAIAAATVGVAAACVAYPPATALAAKAWSSVRHSHFFAAGARRDALVLLTCAAIVAPYLKNIGSSPILGFLAVGTLLGPDGLGVVSQVKTEQALAELGVSIFLFEMGLELSLERLQSMKKQIFGLGLLQYVFSTMALALLGPRLLGLRDPIGLLVFGAAAALSSSAFALQLLRDKGELASRHGRAAFGVLLFQDLAVVPLLVALPLLRAPGTAAAAFGQAGIKAGVAFVVAELFGKRLLDFLFFFAASSKSQEAFLSVVLLTVIGMSATTEALGLSGTLGAFLAGVALSETRYRYQVEADIAPFRGLLLGLFFVTVGFSIDPKLLWPAFKIGSALLSVKAVIATAFAGLLKLPFAAALRAGLLLAPGGEFAFVALRDAAKYGVMSSHASKLLQTTTALTMAFTPLLSTLGSRLSNVADRFEAKVKGTTTAAINDQITKDEQPDVVVCGYGTVGKVVCEMLDDKLVKYICFDYDPQKATEARERGKPVFFGDFGRPEVLEFFKVGDAKIVVVAVAGQKATNRVVVTLRRLYPNLQIIARAVDKEHQRRLSKVLGVVALIPTLPEDSRLLSLPFAGAVLRALDYESSDVDMLIEDVRRDALGIYDGFQSANLIDEEQEALMEQLGILTNSTTTEKDVQ